MRDDQPDVVYKTEAAKFDAVVDDIAEQLRERPAGADRHDERRALRVPVEAADQARRRARGAQRQAARPGGAIIAQAGRRRRGHGRDEHGRPRHRHHARRQPRLPRRPAPAPAAASTRSTRREEYEAAWDDDARRGQGRGARARHEKVVEAGGLYVLGTERHESRRIDNQLRGRSGRQGDPGRVALLPLARRRPHAAVQRRHGRVDHEPAATCRTTCRSSRRWSPGPSAPRRPRSSSRTSRSARTSSSTTRS